MLLNSVITDINYMIKEELGVKGPEKLMTLKGNICQARPPPSSRGTSHKDCFRKCCILQNRLFRHVKATTGLEAHLHQAYKHCAVGAMPSQTYGNVLWWWSP